ncbi:hypothetical protein MSG28_008845 [Choristoneura fumiferana]|uniref:Uncharacterized protein n=1 Tax=Choristoneura fumiferana TaxID=7141 RepID=A0ACC0J875_CHOFU|nr:hypothetical protein MSG28_008845 [Choristoneura fumiferana]
MDDTESTTTSADENTGNLCDNPTRDTLAEGLLGLLKPTVDQLDERVRATRADDALTNIFQKRGEVMLSTEIMSLTKVMIIPDDGLPDKVCSACVRKLDDCSDFVKQCESSDLYLRGFIKNKDKHANDITIKKYSDIKDEPDGDTDLFEDISEETSILHEIVLKTENTAKPDVHIKNRKPKKAQKEQCSTCGKVLSSK